MLRETYSQYYDEDSEDSPSIDEFLEENALKFSDEPEPESELDSIMEMLDTIMDSDEELERVESEGKAPTYKGSELKSNNEKGKTEATVYEFKSKTTKTPGDSRSELKVARMRVRLAVKFLRKKMIQLSQSIRHS